MPHSQRPGMGESPEYTEPIMETYAGKNIPYRGTNDHGVDTDWQEPHEYQDWSGATPDTMAPLPDVAEPIAVRIVDNAARELRRFRTTQYPVVAGRSVNVVGQDDNRSSIILQNTDAANVVYIGDQDNVNASTGYPLGPNDMLTLRAETAVYAFATTGAPVLAIVTEFSVREG